jgi:hypothetical protein
MGRKKIIVILGIIAMTLLVSQPADADNIAYTRRGWVACSSLVDLSDAMGIFWARDHKALAEMVAKGRCFIFSDEVKVYYWRPEWADRERQIRFPGSSETYWVDIQALIYRGEKSQEGKDSPMSKREWFVLDSFLWIKPNKTKKQEIIQKYGKPISEDEDSILYNAAQHSDFKEWKTIKFILNTSGVVEGIRAEK